VAFRARNAPTLQGRLLCLLAQALGDAAQKPRAIISVRRCRILISRTSSLEIKDFVEQAAINAPLAR